MDFFQRQDQARKNTKLLVLYFALAVAGIIAAVYLASLMVFAGVSAKTHRYGYDSYQRPSVSLWNPQLFGGVALGTLAIIGLGSAFKIAQLSSGGSAVAESLGGRLVNSNTTDPDERKLMNIVEEMSIASGVPMPQVFVMDNESGINAFAAGHSPSDAAVAVTLGCMKTLTRDELQGVIGHEFSHILNGDMRMNLRLMGIIFGIVSLVTIGRILLRFRGSGRNQNPLPLFGLLLIIIGAVGAFFANLIQAAVSRQREFLADASAVQFTRNPSGLSGALQKIGGAGSVLASEHAQEASHMFFSNGLKSSFFNAFATHPPLEKRIKAIDPMWDGKFKTPALFDDDERPSLRHAAPPLAGMAGAMGFSGEVHEGASQTIWWKPPPMSAEKVLPSLGQPTPLHLRYAEQFRDAIPEDVKAALHEPVSAAALVFVLLLDGDASLHAGQREEIARRFPAASGRMPVLAKALAGIATRARLPLVNLSLPALRQLTADDYRRFSDTLQWLIKSDSEVDLFEFALQKTLRLHLAPQFGRTRRIGVQYYSIKPLMTDCSVLLSALAHVGNADELERERAFDNGAPYLRSPNEPAGFYPADSCGLTEIDAALDRLTLAAPQLKRNLLEACVQVVGADGVVQEAEAELLRAIGDTLDCPIPPYVTTE